MALASGACGVVLPAAEDVEGTEPGESDPATTKRTPGTPGSADAGSDAAVPPAGPRVYSVFVTSQLWSADKIGGLSGADQKCATLANASPNSKNKKWAAWLSTGSTKASLRLGATPGPWARPDGSQVAQDRAQLTDTLLPLFTAISVDELGRVQGDLVWTGTRSDGDAANDTCNGWTSTSGRGVYGRVDSQKPYWTQQGEVDCGGWGDDNPGTWAKPQGRLYCFEID